jgi:hypothetical protein
LERLFGCARGDLLVPLAYAGAESENISVIA